MALLLNIDWSFFQDTFMGETVENYCWFAGIILATILLKKPVSLGLSNLSHSISTRISKQRHAEVFRDLLRKPIERLFMVLLFYVAFTRLSALLDNIIVMHRSKGPANVLDIRLGDIVDHVFLFIIIVSATIVATRIVDFIYFLQKEKAHDIERRQLLPLVKEVVKLLVWTTSLFWMLGTVFHVNIPALITGLGIGGIAIALAAKESVENFFAAITLLSDRPFKVGDTIRTGSFEGMVERIGFRSCRLRNSDGSAYIIPNQKLVSESLENLTDKNAKNVTLNINVKYGVPHDKVTQMIDELKTMITKTTHVKEPVEVALENFGENTFRIVVNYNLPYPQAEGVSDKKIKQDINLRAYEIAYRYTGGNLGKIQNAKDDDDKAEGDA